MMGIVVAFKAGYVIAAALGDPDLEKERWMFATTNPSLLSLYNLRSAAEEKVGSAAATK
jgi:hypothetical protein